MCGGQFYKKEVYYNGKDIYCNKGYILYSDDADGWSVGEEFGLSDVWSHSSGLCPSESQSWSFLTGENEVKDATIIVTKI